MTTTITPDTIQFGVSQYTGERVARYATCPYCGSDIHRYPRMAWPHGHRMYHKCTGCTYGAWEHDETAQVLAMLGAGERARQPSTISGYWLDNVAVTDPPSPFCRGCGRPDDLPCICPPDDAVYLRAWRDGAFDDELEGYSEADFYTQFERLVSGE